MARAIVDDPESVTVAEKVTENGTVVLELSVAPDDMGKVIGRGGRIAKAIRQVMKVAANNCGKRVTVDIREQKKAMLRRVLIRMNNEKQKQSGGKDEQFRLFVLFVLRKAL